VRGPELELGGFASEGVFVRSVARARDQILGARARIVRTAGKAFLVDEVVVVRHSAGDTVQRRIDLPPSLLGLRFESREAAEQAVLDALELG
jgi:hypothetical protein